MSSAEWYAVTKLRVYAAMLRMSTARRLQARAFRSDEPWAAAGDALGEHRWLPPSILSDTFIGGDAGDSVFGSSGSENLDGGGDVPDGGLHDDVLLRR